MIVLINPWSTPSPKRPLPMSLLSLASLLEGEFAYEIIDGNIDSDPVAVVDAIAAATPLTAIGVTVMPGPQLTESVRVSRALKERFPGVPIVWGGYFPSQHAEVCLRDAAVDYCVRGQGEHTFLALIRMLTAGDTPSGIPGLSFKADGRIHHAPARPLSDLEPLPDWPYHRVPMERYLHRHYLGTRVAAHHSSYGCPFACTFCAVVSMANRKWVSESPDRVTRVLGRLRREYQVDAVQFHDMDFFISEPRTAAIAAGIASLDLTWWALGRVDELMRYTDRTWNAMRASGLKMLFCGAESGSTDTLRRMNKGGTASAELTLELVRRAKAFRVVPELSFVVGNPPDPEGDLRQTLEFIRRVKTLNEAAEIILYVYSPVPLDGTFYREAEAHGFRFPETLDEWIDDRWQTFALRRDPRTPWSRGGIRRRVRNFETVLNAYFPTVTDMRLTPGRRGLLRATGAWRYHSRAYAFPVELNALQRVMRYQRPETTGF
jgi:anaerobic magnesium-protoporphyrin IX monomethyl ester cyclase